MSALVAADSQHPDFRWGGMLHFALQPEASVYTLMLLFAGCAPPTTTEATAPPPVPEPTTPAGPTTPTTETGGTTVPDDSITVGGLVFDGSIPRNLLVVSVDTTRRDHLSYFSGTNLTPNLDSVLNEAYVLTDHRSCSNWTGPSMTCVVSGKTAGENGFWPGSGLPEAGFGPTAKLLGDIGYRSTVVTGNGVFFVSSVGTTWGFDKEVNLGWQTADVLSASALEEVALLQAQPDPWYFHVHFMDPHNTYCPPSEYLDSKEVHPEVPLSDCDGWYGNLWNVWYEDPLLQMYAIENALLAYEAEIAFWDAEFGAMWTQLDKRGALDDTLVVFVTDHGEQFGERGGFYHGVWMGSEENRSTAAFWAKNLDAGVWEGVTIHQDVAATLQAVFGLKPPRPISGIVAGTGAADRVVVAYNLGTTMTAASHTRQLVYDWGGNKWLFELDTDPAGLVNVYDPSDPDVAALWTVLDPAIDDLIDQFPWIGEPPNRGP